MLGDPETPAKEPAREPAFGVDGVLALLFGGQEGQTLFEDGTFR